MSRATVVPVLISLAAAGAIAWAAWDVTQPHPTTTADQVCAAVEQVRDAVDLASVGDQAVLASRAAALADALSRTEPGDDGSDLAAARAIVAVLDDPDATVDDLVAAIAPVARRCGVAPLSG